MAVGHREGSAERGAYRADLPPILWIDEFDEGRWNVRLDVSAGDPSDALSAAIDALIEALARLEGWERVDGSRRNPHDDPTRAVGGARRELGAPAGSAASSGVRCG